MRGGSTLIVTALVVCSAVCAQELADSPIIPDTSGEACSENSLLEPSQVHSQPTGLTVLWPAAHGPKRLFGIIPNYRADQAQGVYTPLTRREKFEIARKDSFDWPNYFLLAGYALQSQVAAGGFSHNGGLRGFAEYYGRAAGDQVIGSYITEALMPSLLHEDPRYFRLGAGPVWRRAYYAASRIVITKGDNGRNRLYLSELTGNAAVIAITSSYYPSSRSPGEAFERYSQQLGNDAISNLLTEFWPDIKRHLPFVHRPHE